jgi:uncharacterized protein
MRFYGREKELSVLKQLRETAWAKGSRILVITGRRRIGKTRLALESVHKKNHIYFFTKKKRIEEIILEWSNDIKNTLGEVFYGNFSSFEEFVRFLFDYSRKRPLVLIFDEIQNLLSSEPSAFGTFQKIFDMKKEKSNALLIFTGSSYTLMEKIFKNSKEPLFGRASEIMRLSYLPLKIQSDILKDNSLDSGMDLLHLYSIFDGIPKYIEELIDLGEKSFKERLSYLVTQRDFIWEEGDNLIREEFGRDYSSYFSILSAISRGSRKLNEIEEYTGIKDAGAYIKNLEDIYNMIERRLPITSRSKKERKGRYYIRDNFLDFWFRFIESKRNLKEIGKTEQAFSEIWQELPSYEGRKLEEMAIRKIIEENPDNLRFSKAGKYWDRKGKIEIDTVLWDQVNKKVYLYEVKINKNKINKAVMEDLKKKGNMIPQFEDNEIFTGKAYVGKEDIKIEPE